MDSQISLRKHQLFTPSKQRPNCRSVVHKLTYLRQRLQQAKGRNNEPAPSRRGPIEIRNNPQQIWDEQTDSELLPVLRNPYWEEDPCAVLSKDAFHEAKLLLDFPTEKQDTQRVDHQGVRQLLSRQAEGC